MIWRIKRGSPQRIELPIEKGASVYGVKLVLADGSKRDLAETEWSAENGLLTVSLSAAKTVGLANGKGKLLWKCRVDGVLIARHYDISIFTPAEKRS